jgi:hypothetical protein
MVNIETFRQLAFSLPEVTEAPHFEKTSFRVNKKIFATLDVKNSTACVKLSAIDQDVFLAFDNTVIYPVLTNGANRGGLSLTCKQCVKICLLIY